MAVNVTVVRQVNPFDTIEDSRISDFIADAQDWLNALGLASAPCHTPESLDLVTKYLACHLAAMLERQTTSEKIGSASESYGGNFGKNLDFTQYGQMAKQFDCSGILERQGKTKVSMAFFGGADN